MLEYPFRVINLIINELKTIKYYRRTRFSRLLHIRNKLFFRIASLEQYYSPWSPVYRRSAVTSCKQTTVHTLFLTPTTLIAASLSMSLFFLNTLLCIYTENCSRTIPIVAIINNKFLIPRTGIHFNTGFTIKGTS